MKPFSTLHLNPIKGKLLLRSCTNVSLMGILLARLFRYYDFPETIKTNMKLEQGFNKEKQKLYSKVAKANLAHMLATLGKD